MTAAQPNTQQLSEYIIQLLPQAELIYLFGSQSNGQAKPDSDYDLAVLLPESLSSVKRWELAQQLADLIGSDVDLIDLRQASPVLRMQIIDKGELIFGQKNTATAFEMQSFSMYGNVQESRKEIISDFTQRLAQGTTHG